MLYVRSPMMSVHRGSGRGATPIRPVSGCRSSPVVRFRSHWRSWANTQSAGEGYAWPFAETARSTPFSGRLARCAINLGARPTITEKRRSLTHRQPGTSRSIAMISPTWIRWSRNPVPLFFEILLTRTRLQATWRCRSCRPSPPSTPRPLSSPTPRPGAVRLSRPARCTSTAGSRAP
jgi:hypothetical protein